MRTKYLTVLKIPFSIIGLILMVIGLVSIIIGKFVIIRYNQNSEAMKYTGFNNLACSPNKKCSVKKMGFPNDKLWSNYILIPTDFYNNMVAKCCADLVSRVEEVEKSSSIFTPKNLILQDKYQNNKKDPVFGGIWTGKNSHGKIVAWVAFRGAILTNLKEWQQVFTFEQQALPKVQISEALSQKIFSLKDQSVLPSVHKGFLEIYQKFRSKLHQKLRKLNPAIIVVTGHSLGGAVATLCATDLAAIYQNSSQTKVICYTFGTPRVGDSVFSDSVSRLLKIYRIVNTEDIVPTLPPSVCPNFTKPKNPFLYSQCGILVPFTLNLKSISNNHYMYAYINGLEKILPTINNDSYSYNRKRW